MPTIDNVVERSFFKFKSLLNELAAATQPTDTYDTLIYRYYLMLHQQQYHAIGAATNINEPNAPQIPPNRQHPKTRRATHGAAARP